MARGTLLAESLQLGVAFEPNGMVVTQIVRRGPFDEMPRDQPPIWTFVEFTIDDCAAAEVAAMLASRLDPVGGWYCDFRTAIETFVAFPGRVFRYRRGDAVGRSEAAAYARSIGIPGSQIDWPE